MTKLTGSFAPPATFGWCALCYPYSTIFAPAKSVSPRHPWGQDLCIREWGLKKIFEIDRINSVKVSLYSIFIQWLKSLHDTDSKKTEMLWSTNRFIMKWIVQYTQCNCVRKKYEICNFTLSCCLLVEVILLKTLCFNWFCCNILWVNAFETSQRQWKNL